MATMAKARMNHFENPPFVIVADEGLNYESAVPSQGGTVAEFLLRQVSIWIHPSDPWVQRSKIPRDFGRVLIATEGISCRYGQVPEAESTCKADASKSLTPGTVHIHLTHHSYTLLHKEMHSIMDMCLCMIHT